MTKCVVLFNGPSLNRYLKLPKAAIEIGCNHIQTLRPCVDHVVAYDDQILQRIPPRPGIQYHTRNGRRRQHWAEVSFTSLDQPHCSGTMAVLLARNLKCSSIRIVGCDWGITTDSLFDQEYQRHQPPAARKHTNSKVRQMDRWMRSWDIRVVSDQAMPFSTATVTWSDFELWLSPTRQG